MDSAAVMSEVETAIFAIITSAGEARASLYEALEKARAGQMVESQQCMSQEDMQLRTAHDVQTDLITRISTARCRCRFCSSMPKIS